LPRGNGLGSARHRRKPQVNAIFPGISAHCVHQDAKATAAKMVKKWLTATTRMRPGAWPKAKKRAAVAGGSKV
jgi:hypothetical protein